MSLKKVILTLSLITVFGCSFKSPDHEGRGLVSIDLQDEPPKELNLMALSSDPITSIKLFSVGPTSSNDFRCFAVNVTGPGVPTSSKDIPCETIDNYSGTGVGEVSDPQGRGTTFEMQVPAGNSRRVDVYGLFPAVEECTGDESTPATFVKGYLLGTTTKDILDDVSLTIPISFDTASNSESFVCKGDNPLIVPLDSFVGKGFFPPASACIPHASVTPTAPARCISGCVEFSAPQYGTGSQDDASYTAVECTEGAGNNTMVAQFAFDLRNGGADDIEFFEGGNLRFRFNGEAGGYTGGCSTSPPTYGGAAVQFYDAGAGVWANMPGGIPNGDNFYVFDAPFKKEYATDGPAGTTGNTWVWFRVVSGPVAGGDCALVRVDGVQAMIID